MRRILFLVISTIFFSVSYAQVMMDDFESNQYGWNEVAGKRGTAIIKDGVLHMESKGAPLLITTYAPFDINKPFILKCEALAKKIDDDKIFGLVLDYEDENNFLCFYISEGEAHLEVFKEEKIVAKRYEAITLKGGKKKGIDFEVEYNLNELVFKVNGAKALAYRRRVEENNYLLGTSGIGFFARKGQVIDFDNLTIEQ